MFSLPNILGGALLIAGVFGLYVLQYRWGPPETGGQQRLAYNQTRFAMWLMIIGGIVTLLADK